MKKIVSVLSTLAVLFAANLSISSTSAKADYWVSTPLYGGGTIHRYVQNPYPHLSPHFWSF